MSGRSLGDRAFIGMQYLLPQHLLSRIVGWIAESRIGFVRAGLIRAFLSRYPVDLAEAAQPDAGPLRELQRFLHAPAARRRTELRRGSRGGALPGRWHGEPGRPHRGRHAAAGQGHRLLGRGPARRRRRAGGGIRGRRFRDHLPRAPQLPPRAHAAGRDAAPRAIRPGRPVQRQCDDRGQRAGPVRAQRAHCLRLRHAGRAARRRAGRCALRRQHEPRLGRADPWRRAAQAARPPLPATRSSRSTAAPSSAGSTWDRPWSCCSRRRVRRSPAAISAGRAVRVGEPIGLPR